jgi:hypothetical protein
MIAEFKRDRYGLQLVFTPKSNEERTLLNELVSALPWNQRGKRLHIKNDVTGTTVNSLTVLQGGYISKAALRLLGFAFLEFQNLQKVFSTKIVSGTTYIIIGTYNFQVYMVNEVIGVDDMLAINYNLDTKEFYFEKAPSGDPYTLLPHAQVQSMYELEALLKIN